MHIQCSNNLSNLVIVKTLPYPPIFLLIYPWSASSKTISFLTTLCYSYCVAKLHTTQCPQRQSFLFSLVSPLYCLFISLLLLVLRSQKLENYGLCCLLTPMRAISIEMSRCFENIIHLLFIIISSIVI